MYAGLLYVWTMLWTGMVSERHVISFRVIIAVFGHPACTDCQPDSSSASNPPTPDSKHTKYDVTAVLEAGIGQEGMGKICFKRILCFCRNKQKYSFKRHSFSKSAQIIRR